MCFLSGFPEKDISHQPLLYRSEQLRLVDFGQLLQLALHLSVRVLFRDSLKKTKVDLSFLDRCHALNSSLLLFTGTDHRLVKLEPYAKKSYLFSSLTDCCTSHLPLLRLLFSWQTLSEKVDFCPLASGGHFEDKFFRKSCPPEFALAPETAPCALGDSVIYWNTYARVTSDITSNSPTLRALLSSFVFAAASLPQPKD